MGDGTAAYGGDGGPASLAKVSSPYAVAVDAFRYIYIADDGNNRIRRIDTAGIVTTIAGTGVAGFSGDGGPATAANLFGPRALAIDANGNIYFSDCTNNRIRKIDATGMISTVAGNGTAGFNSDSVPATDASLNFASGITLDGVGNLFIADKMNNRIRKVDTSGIITTIAGTGVPFFRGDGGPATAAWVQYPESIASDRAGNLYVADNGNNRVRKINTAGIISTIAGSAIYGFGGDGGPSTGARIYNPQGVATDTAGNVYFCDVNNSRIRKINTLGIISSIAGNGTPGFSGDGGPAFMAAINRPASAAIDRYGNVYIADKDNNRIRMVRAVHHAPFFTGGRSQPLSFCPTEWVTLDALLSTSDADTGQTMTWSVSRMAYHGVVAGCYTATSTGTVMTPSGFIFTPDPGYIGTDSFKIRITDGIYSDTTAIHITILSLPDAGSITGTSIVCAGDSVRLADTNAGGVWSDNHNSIATISTAGMVKGVAPGNTIVSYTVTNTCGTESAYFTIKVNDCTTSVDRMQQGETGIVISPNPGNGLFTFTVPARAQGKVHFTIRNTTGITVKQFIAGREPEHVQLDVPPGMYFVTAADGTQQWTGRVVVAK